MRTNQPINRAGHPWKTAHFINSYILPWGRQFLKTFGYVFTAYQVNTYGVTALDDKRVLGGCRFRQRVGSNPAPKVEHMNLLILSST